MKVEAGLASVTRLYLDTAPVIYWVERNLQLTDALQIATALETGCEAFLTNDTQLKRIGEVKVLVIGELEV